MFIDLKRVFKKLFKGTHARASLHMREVFKGSGFANLPPCMFDQYPVPIPPNMTIEAYVVRFLVSEKSLTQLIQICQHAGYVVNPNLSTQVMMKNAQHLPAQKMMLFLYPAFGGVIVSFACNDLDVLAAVQRSALEPPLPAESFPWFEPENVVTTGRCGVLVELSVVALLGFTKSARTDRFCAGAGVARVYGEPSYT